MEWISGDSVKVLSNPGVQSRQLLSPGNSQSRQVTLTEVHLTPGARQERHMHQTSEQVWYALQGKGVLLLAEGKTAAFSAGDVARFDRGEVHGLENQGEEAFVYLSVTSPPLDFRSAYQTEHER